MNFEEFRKKTENMKKPVQRELFTKEEADKEYNTLTENMKKYVEDHRKRPIGDKFDSRQVVIKNKDVVSESKTKEQNEVEVLWGPVHYQLPGKYHSIGASERVPVYFGSDGKWRVSGEIVSDTYALKLIEDDEEIESYNKIMEDIRKIKEKIKPKL